MRICLIIVMFFFTMESVLADMANTRICNENIRKYENDLRHQGEIYRNLQNDLSARKKNLAKLQADGENFSKQFFIPDFIKQKKLDMHQKKIKNLNKEIQDVEDQARNCRGRILNINSNLNTQRMRLHSFRRATLSRIKIKSYGKWDPFDEPEICVKMNSEKLNTVKENSSELDYKLNKDLGSNQIILEVFDIDIKYDDPMGTIRHNLSTTKTGVDGDTDRVSFKGICGDQTDLYFEYIIECDIEY